MYFICDWLKLYLNHDVNYHMACDYTLTCFLYFLKRNYAFLLVVLMDIVLCGHKMNV